MLQLSLDRHGDLNELIISHGSCSVPHGVTLLELSCVCVCVCECILDTKLQCNVMQNEGFSFDDPYHTTSMITQ